MKRGRRPRAYNSDLRREQAEQTAQLVLGAVGRRLAKGDRTISYAAIAREAGVSVPTVYRHFPTQEHMFQAFAELEAKRRPETIDLARLREQLRAFFAERDPEDPRFTQRLSVVWEFSRAGSVPRRREVFRDLLAREAPNLPAEDRDAIVDLGIVLVSTAIAEAFRGYLELPGSVTADRVTYAIEVLFAHARTRSRAQTKEKP